MKDRSRKDGEEENGEILMVEKVEISEDCREEGREKKEAAELGFCRRMRTREEVETIVNSMHIWLTKLKPIRTFVMRMYDRERVP
jgi:hypothetical protein